MRNSRAWFATTLILVSLWLNAGVEAATQKKPKPPPPIPTDASLGFLDNTRDELLASVRRVGVLPITDLPSALKDRDDGKQLLQDAVIKYMRLAGFDVVGPATYQAAFERLNQQLGGIYDPTTGELRREAADSVQQNALREFLSNEHLDGFVYIRVRPTGAEFSADYANWDGVHERSDGKVPSGNSFVELLSASDSVGNLPALSLLVQIVSKQGRAVYQRSAGIQLSSYATWVKGLHFEFQGSPIQFQDVAADDLLKNPERIDRAARVATLPLVHTPKEISLGHDDPLINALRIDLSTLPSLPAGKPPTIASPLLVPRDRILQSVRRVALGAVDPERFDVPAQVQQRLLAGIKEELAALNWEIVDAPEARRLLQKSLTDMKLFDPLTGKRDEARASAARKSVFNALGIAPMPDAILWVGLVRTSVVHDGGDVKWDGANQNGITMGPISTKFMARSSQPGMGSGSISALSLSVFLTDATDTPLYRSRGGIQLLQRIKSVVPNYQSNGVVMVDLAPSELFQDSARERSAVHFALRDLVLTPEQLDLELSQSKGVPKEKKKK